MNEPRAHLDLKVVQSQRYDSASPVRSPMKKKTMAAKHTETSKFDSLNLEKMQEMNQKYIQTFSRLKTYELNEKKIA